MDIINLFNFTKDINIHLFNIGVAFVLLSVLLVMGHMQVKEMCMKRLARDGEVDSSRYKLRYNSLLVAKLSSFISCTYMILACCAILRDRHVTIIDYTIFYKMSTDLMILITEYLTVVRIHKTMFDRTRKPRVSTNYDVIIAVVYSVLSVFIVHSVRVILNSYTFDYYIF